MRQNKPVSAYFCCVSSSCFVASSQLMLWQVGCCRVQQKTSAKLDGCVYFLSGWLSKAQITRIHNYKTGHEQVETSCLFLEMVTCGTYDWRNIRQRISLSRIRTHDHWRVIFIDSTQYSTAKMARETMVHKLRYRW